MRIRRPSPARLLRWVLDFFFGIFLSAGLFIAAALILVTSPFHAAIWGRRCRVRLTHHLDQSWARREP